MKGQDCKLYRNHPYPYASDVDFAAKLSKNRKLFVHIILLDNITINYYC